MSHRPHHSNDEFCGLGILGPCFTCSMTNVPELFQFIICFGKVLKIGNLILWKSRVKSAGLKFILYGLGTGYRSWKLIEQAVLAAEQFRFWGFVLEDHYMSAHPFATGAEDPNSILDTWIALTYLAAKTKKVMLGTLVTPIPFRPPAMLAKMVSTLDILSSGRTILGVGAGWLQAEFEGYSEWNDAKTRVSKTEEAIRLILKLWQERRIDFHGKFYRANGAVLEPKPVQKPHPPLLFGGSGKRMLRLAGRYGDICFIRSSDQLSFDKAKTIVSQEALKLQRQDKPEYASGSPRLEGTRLDAGKAMQDVDTAANNGCAFYIATFPRENYLASIELFAKHVMPSYSTR